jgi:hypothetical protein
VLTKPLVAGTKRCDQALLPDECQKKRVPLDSTFYVNAVIAKVAPMLSVHFIGTERASRRNKTMDGETIEMLPETKAAQSRLLGEASAEAALLQSYRSQRLFADSFYVAPAGGEGDEQQSAKKQKTINSFFKKMS